MNQKNKVSIKINGQEYPIVGSEPKEYLLKVGSFVDDNMELVAKANNRLSTSMIAVLTCINISDQYLKLTASFEELKKEFEKPQDRIKELEEYVDSLHEQLDVKDAKYLELEGRIVDIESNSDANEEVAVLRSLLSEKDRDIEKTQMLINDLQNKLFDNQIKLVQAMKELEGYTMKNPKSNKDYRGK